MILYVWQYSSGAFSKTAIIDNATSIIWVKRFNTTGEFELYLGASNKLLELFTGEIILTRDDDDTVMYVENISLETDAEDGNYLTITGRSSECLIGRRIVLKQRSFENTTAETVIRTLLNENLVNPSQSMRKNALITLGSAQGYTETINKQVTGKNLLDTISDICIEQNYGFKFTFTNGKFEFNLYKGSDRSFNQTANSYVIFSPEFENLGNTEYSRNTTTYYNSVYVAGEGEGIDRTIVNANALKGGIYLREKWVDARQMSSNTEDGTLTPEQYGRLLLQQAKEELQIARETVIFDGEILDTNVYIYGVDYELGDTVQIVNEYGITGTATITEITEVEDENGYKIYPTLSDWSV